MNRRILIVDDHSIVVDPIKDLLEDGFKGRGVGIEVQSCSTMKACAALLLSNERFDLVLMDLGLPDLPRQNRPPALGVYFVKTLVSTPVMVVSGTDDEATIEQCRVAGARGFLSKAAAQKLMIAVDAALDPGEFFNITNLHFPTPSRRQPASMPTRLASGASNGIHSLGLTPRQHDVLDLMIDGRSNKEIAARFNLSEGTVKIHVRFVLEKLGIMRRIQAKEAVEALKLER